MFIARILGIYCIYWVKVLKLEMIKDVEYIRDKKSKLVTINKKIVIKLKKFILMYHSYIYMICY